MNGGGTDQKLVEPGRKGFDRLRRIDGAGVDGERVGRVQGSLFLSVGLDVPVMSWGDPVSFGIHSFAQWDLEVGVHGIADVSIWGPFVGFGIPFDSQLKSLDFVLEGEYGEAMDLFAVLDSLDQTGRNFSEGGGIDVNIGGEYVFHSTRGVAGRG